MDSLDGFLQIAPYLTHPLSLVGFVLLLFFGIHRLLLRAGIIQPLSPEAGGKIVHVLLRYGFIVALSIVFLGFALEFWKSAITNGITIGITLEEYKDGLKRKEEEVLEKLTELTAKELEKRAILAKELANIKTKLANLHSSYEEHKSKFRHIEGVISRLD